MFEKYSTTGFILKLDLHIQPNILFWGFASSDKLKFKLKAQRKEKLVPSSKGLVKTKESVNEKTSKGFRDC